MAAETHPLVLGPCTQRPFVWHIYRAVSMSLGFPAGSDGKECTYNRRSGFDPWVRKLPWRRAGQPTPVFFSGESQGQRNLVGYSPWGHRVGHTE